MSVEAVIASVVGAVMAVLYFWVVVTLLRLDRELTKAEVENRKLLALAKSYLDRAHAAESELESLKPEIDDWFFRSIGPQKSPSSVPAIQAQTKQLAAELEESG